MESGGQSDRTQKTFFLIPALYNEAGRGELAYFSSSGIMLVSIFVYEVYDEEKPA